MASTVIGGPGGRVRSAAPAPLGALVAPFIAVGLVLSGVAAVDLGFAWIPFRLGSGEWEFGVISRTFDGLALGTMGVTFLLAAGVASGSRPLLLVLGVFFVLAFVGLLGAAAIYALNIPVALRAVPADAKGALIRAISRTSCFIALYLPLYAWFSWFTWRRFGAARQGMVG